MLTSFSPSARGGCVYRFLTISALALASLHSSEPQCYAQPMPVISWQVPDQRITLHEPVILRLVVDNTASDVAVLDLGVNFTQGLLVTIITPTGAIVPRSLEPSDLQPGGMVRIQPGAVYKRDIVIDEWYDFDALGTYGIGVKLRLPIIIGNQKVPPTGETFHKITIDPRDEAALHRRCEAWTTQAVNADPNSEPQDIALRALSHIRDDVAVPYLIRLTSLVTCQWRAIIALGKFTTPEAVDALISLANGNSGYASDARRTVLQTARRVQDSGLRKHIYAALGERQP